MGFDAKRTQVAQSAFDFARYFSSVFDGVRVGGAVLRSPRLVVPEGMSTAGGKRARQSIVLASEDPGAPSITVGWVDIGERRASLRTYRYLETMHQERYKGRGFDVEQRGYVGFFDQAKGFLESCGFGVTVENEGVPRSLPPSRITPDSGSSSTVVGLMVFSAFMLGAVVGGFIVYWRLGH